MRIRIKRRWICCLCIAIVAGGCKSSTEVAVEVPPVADAPAPPASETPAPPAAEPTPAAAAGATGVAAETKHAVAQNFTPPFPERVELFSPPKRALATVRKEDDGGTTVELKGFVNVNGPRAVLSIDGVIAIIPEGGEKYGVQVMSIDPPSAVLQRGKARWPAKLE